MYLPVATPSKVGCVLCNNVDSTRAEALSCSELGIRWDRGQRIRDVHVSCGPGLGLLARAVKSQQRPLESLDIQWFIADIISLSTVSANTNRKTPDLFDHAQTLLCQYAKIARTQAKHFFVALSFSTMRRLSLAAEGSRPWLHFPSTSVGFPVFYCLCGQQQRNSGTAVTTVSKVEVGSF
ncbi:hypothetical protein BC835DRAFT_1307298 [Cytidiella melzeri]|nr:hypothetical protein BC835DRAFT_1307298 [Cytidiella melzeri]